MHKVLVANPAPKKKKRGSVYKELDIARVKHSKFHNPKTRSDLRKAYKKLSKNQSKAKQVNPASNEIISIVETPEGFYIWKIEGQVLALFGMHLLDKTKTLKIAKSKASKYKSPIYIIDKNNKITKARL